MITGCLKMALKHPKTDFELVVILTAHLGCRDVAAFDTIFCQVLGVIQALQDTSDLLHSFELSLKGNHKSEVHLTFSLSEGELSF